MKHIMDPRTVALIGASEKDGTVGRDILDNLLSSKGVRVYPVNPHYKSLLGLECYSDIKAVPEKVDLAVIATPAGTVPDICGSCAEAGVGGVIIISAGFREIGNEGRILEDQIMAVRKKYGIRVLGPNCMGVIRPNTGLNASFLKTRLEKGRIAFISQSGALGSAVLSWAADAHVGFSMFASMGSMVDVDFGDLINFLGEDPYTKSIMIYMESVGDARKFMSAARGFARSKPIIIIKPGRFSESARAATSHTGSMAGDDDVYDAAFRRVGAIRVRDVADLFNAAEVLHSRNLPSGPKLAIITNAGGPGVMATDSFVALGGILAPLSSDTISKLNLVLPAYWSKSNPVDILGDADLQRYVDALNLCLADPDINGILLIHTPQGSANPVELAGVISGIAKKASRPVIAVWMGGESAAKGRQIFFENGIPVYSTPEDAVRTYMYMYNYDRNLKLLYETPAELSIDEAPPKHHLKALVQRALKNGKRILSEAESKSFLRVYNISVAETHLAKSVEEAVGHAANLGYPVAIKISSPDISHKSDVKGVRTGIGDEAALREAYHDMENRIRRDFPLADIEGVVVEKMISGIDYELILGAKRDKDFGAVILFGTGGVFAEYHRDFSIGLAPLNQTLARRLVEGTRASELIRGFRGRAPVDMEKLEQTIVAFSNLIVDFPEIVEADINPLAVANGKVLALDARFVLDQDFKGSATPYPHLVITPYPTRYINQWKMNDGTEVILRPIRPEDEPLEREMLNSLSENTLRYRFFQVIRDISHEMLTRFCNIDYDREMAIVAELKDEGQRKIIGIGRIIMDTDFRKGEFAVVVHDDYQRRGLGYKLVDMLIGIGQERGLEKIYGYVLTDNEGMLKICERFGFYCEIGEEQTTHVTLDLK